MKIVLIGNGILSLMTALRVIQRNDDTKIVVVGPSDREGSATLAAPAMLNSYAELTVGALNHKIDRDKFSISTKARYQWASVFSSLEEYNIPKPKVSLGTYVLNNTTTDNFDDKKIDAIKRIASALKTLLS